jgi:nicotinamide mononucleotide transporter
MSAIEWAAAIIVFISVVLSARQNIWSWPTAIVGVGIYVFVFWNAKLYADMGLQFVFIILSIFGWYEWLHGGEQRTELRVSRAPLRVHLIGTTITILFAAILGTLLHRYTDAALPYADSTLTAFSLLAQWQMARKYLENWLIWIAVDVFYIAMYSYKHLYVTAVLYAAFIVVCSLGYVQWKRSEPKPSPA